jgi:hypothetical protein
MRCFVLWPFVQRRSRNLIAFVIFRKPCQQRQDADAEDGKENQFPDDMQQKRHRVRSDWEQRFVDLLSGPIILPICTKKSNKT